MLTTIIYRSRLYDCIPFSEIEAMVIAASARNEQGNVTGILLFDGLHFFQLLEGPEAEVKTIYQQICRDNRHYNLVELLCDYAPARRFGKSGMVLFDMRKHSQENILQTVLDMGTSKYQLVYHDRALQFFKTFVTASGRDIYYEIPPADSWRFLPEQPPANDSALQSLDENIFTLIPLIDPLAREIVLIEARKFSPDTHEYLSTLSGQAMHQQDLMEKKAALSLAGSLQLNGTRLAITLMPMTLVRIPRAVEFLLNEISVNQLIPEQIVVQFSEHEIISQFGEFASAVKGLKAAGISVAIDHFGVGFAGLKLLAQFQPDIIKINRDLISDVHRSGPQQAIIHAIIQCCHSLEIGICADGVEKAEEWMWLESAGISHFQGQLFTGNDLPQSCSIAWPDKTFENVV